MYFNNFGISISWLYWFNALEKFPCHHFVPVVNMYCSSLPQLSICTVVVDSQPAVIAYNVHVSLNLPFMVFGTDNSLSSKASSTLTFSSILHEMQIYFILFVCWHRFQVSCSNVWRAEESCFSLNRILKFINSCYWK